MRPVWTKKDEALITRLYPNTRAVDIAKRLGRSRSSVYAYAKKLGLKKSDAFCQSDASGRLDGVRGRGTRFKTGHNTWNKGTNFNAGGRSPETRFKKGGKPYNWQPIGSERTSQDGYLQRKVTDTGYPPRDWVPVHRLLWEEVNGPVPPRCLVVFIDGNKKNIALANLKLLTKKQNVKRNSIHNYPPEIKKTMQAIGRLNKQINKREKPNEKQVR